MYTTYRREFDEGENNRLYQKARYDEWLKLRATERKLFVAVVKAWRRHNSEGRWDQPDELPGWITREQIADELDAARLIPYYLKLLNHLCDGNNRRDYTALYWIQTAKRPRWRHTYEGRKRPAGYEWVYLPNEKVIDALNAMNPNQPKREVIPPTVPVLPRMPTYRAPWWERAIDKLLDLLP